MGQSSQKLKVISLNYSAIFVSPFEFYASDNWQQLQKIGIVFQENLKQDYRTIKQQINTISKKQVLKEEFYIRKHFDWMIGKLDKNNKQKRYSPLYIRLGNKAKDHDKDHDPQYIKNKNYPGIKNEGCLMNEKEYYEQWFEWFKKINQKNDGQTEIHMCKWFDFECYKAFVQYLYNQPDNASKLRRQQDEEIDQQQQNTAELTFQNIIELIKAKSQAQQIQLIQVYRSFMDSYFSRIDSASKIQITVRQLFQKNEFDIIFLQQANDQIIDQLKKQQNYYVFIPPFVNDSNDQCIIIINKKCKLIPIYYHSFHQTEQESIVRFKQQTIKYLTQCQKNAFYQQIQQHFEQNVAQAIIKKIDTLEIGKDTKKIKDVVCSYLMNPLKLMFSQWFSPYIEEFKNYWKYKQQNKSQNKQNKQNKQRDAILEELLENDLFYDNSAYTIKSFRFTNKKLSQYQNKQNPLVIVSIHLSSKDLKNKIQVQLLGILLYELVKNDYKFILTGDFNSFIDIKDRERKNGPFLFLRDFYRHDEVFLRRILDLQNEKTIHVFPKHKSIHTTKKKRTILQVQARKINTLAEKCIDQVITNFPILYDECYTGQISHLNSYRNKNKAFIPNRQHPYDHFLVQAIISTSQPNDS